MKKPILPSLTVCIVLDLIGMGSYLLPFIGETFDLIWAPVSGILFFLLFRKTKFGILGGVISFLEELSPGLDFVPTFTIAYILQKIRHQKNAQDGIQIKT